MEDDKQPTPGMLDQLRASMWRGYTATCDRYGKWVVAPAMRWISFTESHARFDEYVAAALNEYTIILDGVHYMVPPLTDWEREKFSGEKTWSMTVTKDPDIIVPAPVNMMQEQIEHIIDALGGDS